MADTIAPSSTFPKLRQVVLDAEDARGLAEFYRQLLGLRYLDDEQPNTAEDDDWLVLLDAVGARVLAFQRVDSMPPPTWPEGPRPQMLHLDLLVDTREELRRQRERAVSLGATVLEDSIDDPEEGIVIFADPAGHPFCIFVPDE